MTKLMDWRAPYADREWYLRKKVGKQCGAAGECPIFFSDQWKTERMSSNCHFVQHTLCLADLNSMELNYELPPIGFCGEIFFGSGFFLREWQGPQQWENGIWVKKGHVCDNHPFIRLQNGIPESNVSGQRNLLSSGTRCLRSFNKKEEGNSINKRWSLWSWKPQATVISIKA